MARRLLRTRTLGFRPGGTWRVVALVGMVAIIVFAIFRFDQALRWPWAKQAEPVAIRLPDTVLPDVRQPVSLRDVQFRESRELREAVACWAAGTALLGPGGPLDAAERVGGHTQVQLFGYDKLVAQMPQRRAPIPDRDLLAGALDREPLWRDNPDDQDQLRRRQHFADMQARNHLLRLAHAARQENLSADALADVSYAEMMRRPGLLRGEVVRVRGTLRWVERLDLQKTIDDLDHAYIGSLQIDDLDRPIAIVFTELPPGFPPESEWRKLNVASVAFDGMFLKVFEAKNSPLARAEDDAIHVPLLVGKGLDFPPGYQPDTGWGWPMLLLIVFLAGSLMVGGTGYLLYRWNERRYLARLHALQAAVHASTAEAAQSAEPQPRSATGPIEFTLQDEHPPENGAAEERRE